ncbi:hypothetical protein DUZ99_11325 [Xylanibacillus composti]|nr:hypothetical protein [Xylanibacillus composti]
MDPAFWNNTIWFILLGIITIMVLAITLLQANNRRQLLAFYLTISGMAFCFEMIVYSFFKAYQYFPMLVPHSPADDSIAGNLFSQFSVSSSAVFLAVFGLGYIWHVVIAAAYAFVEELFLALGIYKHNWYRTWMTVAGLLLLFWLTKKAYLIVNTSFGRIWRFLFLFFGLVTLHQHTIVWVFRLTGVRIFSETFLPDKERSLVVLSGTYMLLLGGIIMIMYFSKFKWGWKFLIIVLLYGGHYVAYRYHLIICKEGWFFITTTISIAAMYGYTFLLDKLYDPPLKKHADYG